jgi:hypothetical protein
MLRVTMGMTENANMYAKISRFVLLEKENSISLIVCPAKRAVYFQIRLMIGYQRCNFFIYGKIGMVSAIDFIDRFQYVIVIKSHFYDEFVGRFHLVENIFLDLRTNVDPGVIIPVQRRSATFFQNIVDRGFSNDEAVETFLHDHVSPGV